jgi:hypothetical protein
VSVWGGGISVVGPEPAHRSSGHKESHDGRERALPSLLFSAPLEVHIQPPHYKSSIGKRKNPRLA